MMLVECCAGSIRCSDCRRKRSRGRSFYAASRPSAQGAAGRVVLYFVIAARSRANVCANQGGALERRATASIGLTPSGQLQLQQRRRWCQFWTRIIQHREGEMRRTGGGSVFVACVVVEVEVEVEVVVVAIAVAGQRRTGFGRVDVLGPSRRRVKNSSGARRRRGATVLVQTTAALLGKRELRGLLQEGFSFAQPLGAASLVPLVPKGTAAPANHAASCAQRTRHCLRVSAPDTSRSIVAVDD
jgi:hypothetical protein